MEVRRPYHRVLVYGPPTESDPLTVEFERIIQQIEQNRSSMPCGRIISRQRSPFLLPWMGRGPALEASGRQLPWCRGRVNSAALDYYERTDGRLPALVLNTILARTALASDHNLDPPSFRGLYKFGPRSMPEASEKNRSLSDGKLAAPTSGPTPL